MINRNEISSTFIADDRRAESALDRKRDDLERARELAPALVASLESEFETGGASLESARAAGLEFDREQAELARATARRQAALMALNTSTEVDPDAVLALVQAGEVSKQIESARKRRLDAARAAATAAYGRVCKDIAARNAAVDFAERLAGAVVDRDESRIPSETRPEVISWARLTLPVEGRAAYQRSYEFRKDHPSYDRPPEIEEFDEACARFFGGVDASAKKAARLAAALATA